MKIQRIIIENFKSIKKIDFRFDDVVTALVAPNGTGKTAFKQAFYAGITGDFPDNCIRTGADACSVQITLDDGTVIDRIQHRTKANKVMVDGKTTTNKTINELISTKTALSKDVLKIATSTDVLQSLQPAEFGSFITAYIPEKLDYASVRGYIPAIADDAEKLLSEALPQMPDTFGIPELTKAYDSFVDRRKLTKRELAMLDAKINSFKGTVPTRTLQIIDDELNATLRKEGAQQATKVAINLYNNAVRNRKVAEENLIKLKAKIDENKSVIPDASVLAKIRATRNELQKAMVDAKTMIGTINENILVFQNTINNLNKPVCPISEKLVCTTDKTAIKEELQGLIASNKEAINIQKQILQKANDDMKKLDEQENIYRANEISYREKMTLIEQFEKQKKAMPELPTKPEVTTIVDYSTIIINLKKERDNAIAYQQFVKDKDERGKKEDLLTNLEFLCNILNAKGEVMNKITAHYLAIFDATCNATASELRSGMEFKFISDNGISYLIKPSSVKEFTKFSSLSSGEQLLALFILTDMLSKLTGSNMMILDDLDKLDSMSFNELLTLIEHPAIQSAYDHIILSAVNHPDIVATLSEHKIKNVY